MKLKYITKKNVFEKKLRKITHEFQYISLASQLLPRYVHEPFAKSEQLYEVVGPKIFYFINNKITSFSDIYAVYA